MEKNPSGLQLGAVMKIITKNEKETLAAAKKFARQLEGGEVIGLEGDLGAGKTVFVKGLAAGLGIKKIITSPTFVLMKVYPVKSVKSPIRQLVHIDAYRLTSGADLEAIGALDYFGQKHTITVIEWPERVRDILLKDCLKIKIKIKNNNQREIIF